MKRNAKAVWNGTIQEGKGAISTQSKTLDSVQYSFKTRFEQGIGTNPEELMAAAHAGCFNMKLSFDLTEAGFTPESLETICHITLDNGVITKSELILTAKVPEITESQFLTIAEESKNGCPVSNAYNMDISLAASLVS